MKRYNKTYRQQPRKRLQRQKQKHLIISALLALTFAGSLYSAITTQTLKQTIQDNTTQQQATTTQYILIKDISNNPDNFRIAHQATAQACQKHGLATTTPDGLHIDRKSVV